MLTFTEGDIFEDSYDIRVNTVNCVGVMGAGVALAFKKRYPDMFKDYQKECKQGRIKPGTMHIWKSLVGDWIINFPTKRHWRDPSLYEDIEAGLNDLRSYLDSVGPVTVALPALGCGNGGLSWKRVSEMIRAKLEGVDAEIFIFAPSASRRAANHTNFPSDDERHKSELLGFTLVEPEHNTISTNREPFFAKGNIEILSRGWIAILPSKAPEVREEQALEAISTELSRLNKSLPVALVYGSKESEYISDVFNSKGIETILFLPFGILKREAVVKRLSTDRFQHLTVVSLAQASEKWSQQLFARTMDSLNQHAKAVLFSDPKPDWLSHNTLNRWLNTPISYVRYGDISETSLNALSNLRATPISRRSESGLPNIDPLLEAAKSSTARRTDAEKPELISGKTDNIEQPQYAPHKHETFKIDLSVMRNNESIRKMIEAAIKANATELSVKITENASDDEREALTSLGFVKNDT